MSQKSIKAFFKTKSAFPDEENENASPRTEERSKKDETDKKKKVKESSI